MQTFTLGACPDQNTCPVETLRSYIDRTSANRPPGPDSMLFISLVAPFRAVTGNSIGRWIKTFLKSAGVDTEIFSAHSTRSAASSLAVSKGISIDKILQAGNWATQTTFSRFYNREQTTTFAASVLADAWALKSPLGLSRMYSAVQLKIIRVIALRSR